MVYYVLVKAWLQRPSIRVRHLKCLQKIMDKKLHDLFVICQENAEHSLEVYYLGRETLQLPNNKELYQLIQNEISYETILLPFSWKESKDIEKKLKNAMAEAANNAHVSVSFCSTDFSSSETQRTIILFGYRKAVSELQKKINKNIEQEPVATFEFDFLDESEVRILLA